MVDPHTPTSFIKNPKSPILDAAFSVDDDEVAKTQQALFGMKQPLRKLNDVFDGLHDRTTQMASLAGPVGTNPKITHLRERLSDQERKHKDVITEIHGILDELELLQGQYVANVKKEVEREITERMDKLVKERVAEFLKTHIPQELQDEVARSNRKPPQNQTHHGSQLPHAGLPMSPRNPSSALQCPSTPTLSHTIASPVHPAHPSALAHSSNSLGLMSPPPTSSTPALSDANELDVSRFVPGATAKPTIKKVAWSKGPPTPSTPAVSSLQRLEPGKGSPGAPNRRPTIIPMETEDQLKSRLAEQEQNDRSKAEAAGKEKEKAEAEHKTKVAEEIVTLEETALSKKPGKKQRRKERKEAEALELKAKQEEEKALRLAQERAKEEIERKENEEREEQERLSKLAAELEGRKGNRKKDGQFEDGMAVDNETSMSMEDGKNKFKDGLRIDTTSINSPTSNKRRPGPLDLIGSRSASRVVAPLAAARFITDIATVSYPEGYKGPQPDLNHNVKNGKFRYDREFLLQFMSVCKERPVTLPPLDAIGLEPVDHSHAMFQGGSGHHRPSSAVQPSRKASIGLGFTPSALGKSGANNLFSMGNFGTMGTGSKLSSEERYANSNRAASISGAPGMQYTINLPSTMQRTTSQSGTGALSG